MAKIHENKLKRAYLSNKTSNKIEITKSNEKRLAFYSMLNKYILASNPNVMRMTRSREIQAPI